MLSICRGFLSNRRQRVVVESATIKWTQSFLACNGEVCWVLFCSSFSPVKCLSWWTTDYMPMLMTPHYWQLFANQQTDLLLLPPLTGTWLGFRSVHTESKQNLSEPSHRDLVLSGVSICASPILNILDSVKFDSRLTFEDHIVYRA